MNCRQAQDLIHTMLDDELSAAQHRDLENHLASCSSCGKIAKQFRAISCGLSQLAAESEYLPSRLPHQERSVDRSVVLFFPFRRWVSIGAAAAIVLLVLGWPLYQWSKPQSTQVVFQPKSPRPEPITLVPSVEATSTFEVQLVGQTDNDYIAVVQKSSDPQVHIVWLYPTVKMTENSTNDGGSTRRPQPTRS